MASLPPPAGLWVHCTGRRMNCRSPFICFAEPASSRRIHPPPFGPPPSPRGHMFKSTLHRKPNIHCEKSHQHAGQTVCTKGTGWISAAVLPASQIPPLRGGSIPRPSGRPLLQGGTCSKAPFIESQTFIVRNPISMQAKRSAPKGQDGLPQPLIAGKRRRIMLCAANTAWPSALSAELLSYPSSPNAFSQMALYFRKRVIASSSFFPFSE